MRTGLGVILLVISFHPVLVSQPTLSNPESLAGSWEAPDGHGGEVGINITLTTTVVRSAMTLLDLPQTLQEFEIGLYQRADSAREPVSFNFFVTAPDGAAAWDGQHFHIHAEARADVPKVRVDLAWQKTSQTWIGSFERAGFRNQAITLRRPGKAKPSPFVGTWYESGLSGNNCLHIAQEPDGSLTGWSDDIRIPGRARFANGLRRPARTPEHYGEMAKVTVTSPTQIEVELWAYIPACCSHLFGATMAKNGNSFVGTDQAPRPARWIRVQGNSCRTAASQ